MKNASLYNKERTFEHDVESVPMKYGLTADFVVKISYNMLPPERGFGVSPDYPSEPVDIAVQVDREDITVYDAQGEIINADLDESEKDAIIASGLSGLDDARMRDLCYDDFEGVCDDAEALYEHYLDSKREEIP